MDSGAKSLWFGENHRPDDASVAEIVDALVRYEAMAGSTDLLPYTTRRWLQVALIKRFLSDNLEFIDTARRYMT